MAWVLIPLAKNLWNKIYDNNYRGLMIKENGRGVWHNKIAASRNQTVTCNTQL